MCEVICEKLDLAESDECGLFSHSCYSAFHDWIDGSGEIVYDVVGYTERDRFVSQNERRTLKFLTNNTIDLGN